MAQTLERALTLVNLVDGGSRSLAEITHRSGLTRSTAHRLLSALVDNGLLELWSKQYSVGPRFFRLGEAKKMSYDFVPTLQPLMERYARLTGDTIHLAILDGTEIELIAHRPGSRQLQISSRVGTRALALKSAVGKALVSRLAPGDWPTLCISSGLGQARERLLAELTDAHKTGVAVDFDEVSQNTCGIAASFEAPTRVRVACSINGATMYFQGDRLRNLSGTVLEMARQMQQSLHQAPPATNISVGADTWERAALRTSMAFARQGQLKR